MKTLNKTLSLVLVLVMVLGLFGVAGAAFTDQNDVKYDEAVDVMTGIGAINGYTDGTIKPTGTITREEAAKLITYAILGKTTAEKLTVGATGFSDVDAGRWSAPFISYLVGEKVIAGMGDGTFAPTANVTGYQFAKMMLCAAGYGAKGEFTGSGWELAVAVAANKSGVFENSKGVDYSKPATREEAMLYAFNGIRVAQVEYNKLFDKYENVLDTKKAPNTADYNTYTIAEQTYPTLINPSFTLDGVNGYVWKYKGVTISGFIADATLLAQSTNGTSYTALTTNNNKDYIGYKPATNVEFYLNGVYASTAQSAITPAAFVLDAAKHAAFNAAAAKKGAVVSFTDKDSDGLYDIVSITVDTVATIGGEVITAKSGEVTYVTVPGIAGLYKINAENVYGFEGLKKDDVVLYHTDGTHFYITKCETVIGTAMAINNTAGVAVIDGKQYKMSDLAANPATTLADVSAAVGVAGTTFYLDEGGFIVAVVAKEAAVSAANAVFVKNAKVVGYSAQAAAVFSDGKVAPITVAKIDNEDPIQADGATKNAKLVDTKFYTFTKNENGTYNLKTVDSARQTNIITYADDANARNVITKGTATFLKNDSDAVVTGLYGTATTAFVYADAIVRSYTGIANAPTYAKEATASNSAQTVVAVLQSTTGYAQFVVAYGGTPDMTTSSTNYAFVTKPATTFGTGTTAYDMYFAVKDGDPAGTFKADVGLGLQMGSLYALNAFDGEKVSAAGDHALIHSFGTDGTGKALAGIADFKVNGTTVVAYDASATAVSSFIVSSDCKVFTYDITDPTDPQLVPSTLGVVNSLAGDTYTIQGIEKAAGDATITQLFVTIQSGNSATLMRARYELNAANAGALTGTMVDVTGAALANGAELHAYTSSTDGYVSVVALAVPYGATVTAASSAAASVSVGSAGADTTTNTLFKVVKFLITDVTGGTSASGLQTITFTITSADGNATSTHTVAVTAK